MSDTIKTTDSTPNIGGYRGSNSGPNSGPGQPRSTNTESPLITIQPTKRSDLQPSYAQVLPDDDDASTTGWYGAMSMHLLKLPCNRATVNEN